MLTRDTSNRTTKKKRESVHMAIKKSKVDEREREREEERRKK